MEMNEKFFVRALAKAVGQKTAEKHFAEVKAEIEEKNKDAHSVYLDALGREVHVNGATVASLSKPETLAEKIARFDRLAAAVAQSRAFHASIGDMFTDEEDDFDDDSFADDTSADLDPFGDPIVSRPIENVEKPAADAAAGKAAAPTAEPPAEQPAEAAGDAAN